MLKYMLDSKEQIVKKDCGGQKEGGGSTSTRRSEVNVNIWR